MATPWFASWFDSPYYPLLYRHRDHAEAERFIEHLLQHLNPAPGSTFLDLACGRGRHSRQLHAHGHIVTGLDLSPASIADAAAPPLPGLQFAVHDMRLPYPARYDFILNLFTSFGYFSDTQDNLRVLANVREALLPGGTFVMDFMNAAKVVAGLVPEEHQAHQGIRFDITRRVESGVIVKRIQVTDGDHTHHFEERVQALMREDLEGMLAASGLALVGCWGDYQGGAFEVERSPRLILFARHQGEA